MEMQRLQKKYYSRSFEFNNTAPITTKTTINRLKKNIELTKMKEEIESEYKDVKEEKKDQKIEFEDDEDIGFDDGNY